MEAHKTPLKKDQANLRFTGKRYMFSLIIKLANDQIEFPFLLQCQWMPFSDTPSKYVLP
jgi:hypothetical protein